MPIRCQNITGAIVGIGVGGIPSSLEEMALVVISVGDGTLFVGTTDGRRENSLHLFRHSKAKCNLLI